MNSYKGELRLADGTPVRVVGDLPVGEWTPVTSQGPRFKWDGFLEQDVHLSGTSTLSSADIDALIDQVEDHYLSPPEIYYYVSKERYWMLQYMAQGKRYPRPRRRKSEVWRERMQKKVRMS